MHGAGPGETIMQSKGFVHSPGADVARGLVALALRLASMALAQRMPTRKHALGAEHTLVTEFHADAGAPEGALYVDGQLVGHVLGVTRL